MAFSQRQVDRVWRYFRKYGDVVDISEVPLDLDSKVDRQNGIRGFKVDFKKLRFGIGINKVPRKFDYILIRPVVNEKHGISGM